jgi:hypothetical protein
MVRKLRKFMINFDAKMPRNVKKGRFITEQMKMGMNVCYIKEEINNNKIIQQS